MTEVTDFLGGLWIPDNFDAQAPNNGLIQADDIEYLPDATIRGRRGRILFSTGNQYPFLSLWRHYPRSADGSQRWLGVFDSGLATVVRHDVGTPGVFTELTGGTGHTAGRPFWFTTWASKDKTFLANGHELLQYDGSAITPVVQSGTAITGPYLTLHQSRLVGTRSDEITYSIYATSVDDETSSPGIHLNLSDREGGSIVGVGTLGDRLIIQKTTGLWSLLGDIEVLAGIPILTQYSNRGALAPRSIAYDEGGFWFVASAGVYWSDGINPNPIEVSLPIRHLFVFPGGNQPYPDAVAVWYAHRDMFVVKLAQSHAHSYRCQRMKLPGKKGTLYLWSRNTSEPGTCLAMPPAERDVGHYFAGDSNGDLWQCDTGSTDGGVAYTPTIRLPARRLSDLQHEGRVHYFFANYRGSSHATVGLRYDNHQSDDVTLTVGKAQTLGLQEVKKKVPEQRTFGKFVSAGVSLPAGDGPEAALYSVRLDHRLRARRVWRG